MARKKIQCKLCKGSIKLKFMGVSIQDEHIEITYKCSVCGYEHAVVVRI